MIKSRIHKIWFGFGALFISVIAMYYSQMPLTNSSIVKMELSGVISSCRGEDIRYEVDRKACEISKEINLDTTINNRPNCRQINDIALKHYSNLCPPPLSEVFKVHVLWDFLLMLSYLYLLFQFCTWAIESNFYKRMAVIMRFGLCLAALLDGTEDALMYQYYISSNEKIQPCFWSYLSVLKFLLLLSVILFLLAFLFHHLKRKAKNGSI
jgi:hypothetical protein